MDGLTIGVYGLYLILVGLKGNAGQLAGKIQTDAPKFLPWIIAIFVLAFINGSSEAGRRITGPFIALLIIAFVVKRFPTLQDQTKQLWDMSANASNPNPAPVVVQSGASSSNPQPAFPATGSTVINSNNASDALFALENVLG